MKDGFVKVCAVTPNVRVADVAFNVSHIKEELLSAVDAGAKVVAFPELCLTGYTCRDLFLSSTLIDAAKAGVLELIEFSKTLDVAFVVGAPLAYGSDLYNSAIVINKGEVLGIVPKLHMPNYYEFLEAKYFTQVPEDGIYLDNYFGDGKQVYLGYNQIFVCKQWSDFTFGVEICEDLWVPRSPCERLCRAGATVMLNLSASNEGGGKTQFRRELVKQTSSKLRCAYVYTSSGWGESTSDIVFGGHNMIFENGDKLAETLPFTQGRSLAQINIYSLLHERRSTTTFTNGHHTHILRVSFDVELAEEELTRKIDPMPFTSNVDKTTAEEILNIQAYGLARRLDVIGAKKIVLGISGGLDSTLALLVAKRAFDILGLPAEGIIAISMPGFGTSDRTHNNAFDLCNYLGATYREISIVDAVIQHFQDIGHDLTDRNVVYENAQARERTQILMDVANAENTFVLGTGDLSELALGWATYNGDHMSMYGVNASIPKTLVRHLVHYIAETSDNFDMSSVLLDICATPVSPELLPADENGEISQITEDKVGPYILHDFIIFYGLGKGAGPKQLFKMACRAFDGTCGAEKMDKEVIHKWFKVFFKRFFSQQYKRSCMPDGPKATIVSVSPRGNLALPSDASVNLWMSELNDIQL